MGTQASISDVTKMIELVNGGILEVLEYRETVKYLNLLLPPFNYQRYTHIHFITNMIIVV